MVCRFYFLLLFRLISDRTCLLSATNYHASNSTTPKQLIASTPNSEYRPIYHTPQSSIEPLNDHHSSTDFHTPKNSTHKLNETVNQSRPLGNSVYQTCVEFPLSFLKRSRSIRQTFRRSSLSNLFDKIAKSPRLSIVRGESINIEGNRKTCTCRSDFTDGNCLKNFMEMSVQPAEYRNTTQQVMTSTPILSKNVDYDQSIFNVARVKKVELHDLKPKVPEIHGKWTVNSVTVNGKTNTNYLFIHLIVRSFNLICLAMNKLIIFYYLTFNTQYMKHHPKICASITTMFTHRMAIFIINNSNNRTLLENWSKT